MPVAVEGPTVGQLLDDAAARLQAAGRATPRLDAEVLLASVLQVSRTALYIRPERVVGEAARSRWDGLMARRLQGEPVAYLTGRREFMSLEFEVTPACLIPRWETELLVETALELLPAGPARVADVGTGSGAIAIALLHRRPDLSMWATDVSPAALDVSRRNAARHGVSPQWVTGSLLDGVPDALDLVVSNPPYVSAAEFAELGVGVRDYEPKSALVAGPTGLEWYRPLAQQAAARLRSGGWVTVEMAPWQGAAVQAILAAAGFDRIQCRNDLAGHPRVLMGRLA